MDYGLDLLMNPSKVNKKYYHSISQKNTHEVAKDHILRNYDFLNKPLNIENLEEIIDITINLYEKNKVKKAFKPFNLPNKIINKPKIEKSKQIEINSKEINSNIDISKVNLL